MNRLEMLRQRHIKRIWMYVRIVRALSAFRLRPPQMRWRKSKRKWKEERILNNKNMKKKKSMDWMGSIHRHTSIYVHITSLIYVVTHLFGPPRYANNNKIYIPNKLADCDWLTNQHRLTPNCLFVLLGRRTNETPFVSLHLIMQK